MEESEFSEESFRRFFGEEIEHLDEDEKINLYKILVEYFLSKGSKKPSADFHITFGKGLEENRYLISHEPEREKSLSWLEELATNRYKWPESAASSISQQIESNKLNEIASSIKLLESTIESSHYKQHEMFLEFNEKLEEISSKAETLSSEIHERYIPQSFGIDPNEYPLSKFLPVKIYLSDHPDHKIPEIISSLGHFLDSIGFLFVDEFPSKRDSWWKSWFGKSKEVMTSEEFTSRLQKGERAIELATLDKVQSEVNKNNSEAASNLIGALSDVDNAAIQIGSLLLVKVTNGNTSSIHTRQLTNKEMILLERNQSLLHQPTLIIERLEKLSCEDAA